MTDDRMTVELHNAHQGHEEVIRLWYWCKAMLKTGKAMTVEARPAKRSNDQNRMLWSILNDIAQQVDWIVDGQTAKLDPEEWKDILTAGLTHEQRVARGINGGVVILGQRTSKMTKGELSQLMELGWAFGAERGVNWSKTSLGRHHEEVPA